jgi:hypothetical protein
MSVVGIYNSTEVFNFEQVGFIVYGSIGLIALWTVAWPAYLLFQKFFLKQAV